MQIHIEQTLNEQEEQQLTHVGTGTIWSFWEGDPPELVLRCLESMKINNPSRPIVIVSKDTLSHFLGPDDYPFFHGVRGIPDDFSCVQYLADWVRLTLLEKYGGVWFDASVICTNSVDTWTDSDCSKVTMFPMHANSNVHGNWAMAATKPGHPLIHAWRKELSAVYNETGPGKVPVSYIERVFDDHPALEELWNDPVPPPLPYLWVYLALQVVLQKQPELHSTVRLLPSIDGPMYRRYLYNIEKSITNGAELSQKTADDLARKPLRVDAHDRWFIKLVGSDRRPVQMHLDNGTFCPGSALDTLSRLRAPPIVYGVDLQLLTTTRSATTRRFRGLAHAVIAAQSLKRLGKRADECMKSSSSLHEDISLSLREEMTMHRRSSLASAA